MNSAFILRNCLISRGFQSGSIGPSGPGGPGGPVGLGGLGGPHGPGGLGGPSIHQEKLRCRACDIHTDGRAESGK